MDIQYNHYIQNEYTLKRLLKNKANQMRAQVVLVDITKTNEGSAHLDVVFKLVSPNGYYTTLESVTLHYDGSYTLGRGYILPDVLPDWLTIVKSMYLRWKTNDMMSKIKEELIATAMHPSRFHTNEELKSS